MKARSKNAWSLKLNTGRGIKLGGEEGLLTSKLNDSAPRSVSDAKSPNREAFWDDAVPTLKFSDAHETLRKSRRRLGGLSLSVKLKAPPWIESLVALGRTTWGAAAESELPASLMAGGGSGQVTLETQTD